MQHGHQERYACRVDSYGQCDKRQTPSPVIQQSRPRSRIFRKSRFRDIEMRQRLKWRATNDRVDPYDAVRHSSGPNGPGDAVEGGVKLGF